MSLHIIVEKCIRCGACIDECPAAAISYADKNMPVVDVPSCTGCGQCLEVCCTQALAF